MSEVRSLRSERDVAALFVGVLFSSGAMEVAAFDDLLRAQVCASQLGRDVSQPGFGSLDR